MNDAPTFHASSRGRMIAVCLVSVAVATAIFGTLKAPERAWPNLLLDSFYIATLGVSALFFLAVQRVAGSRWSANLRRIPEAFLPLIPVGAVLLLILFFHIYFPNLYLAL